MEVEGITLSYSTHRQHDFKIDASLEQYSPGLSLQSTAAITDVCPMQL